MRHLELIADGVIAAVKTHVGAAIGPLVARLNELDAALKAVPAGKDGAPGPQGDRGEKGEPGAAGVNGDPGLKGVDGKDGAPGAPGERGPEGPVGKDGGAGPAGEKGMDGAPGRDGRDGLPGLAGKDGADGINGADGFSLEDFDVSLADDGRTLSFKFSRGELVKERQIKLAVLLDKGIYRPDADYEKGDCVSVGGSGFVAQKDAPAGKPGESDDWRLFVKRGRDGKDGKAVGTGGHEIVRLHA